MSEVSKHETLCGYKRVKEIDVLETVKHIKDAMTEIQKLWEEEVEKYEETIHLMTESGMKAQLRRNYLNSCGIVEDTSLFPYHNACYEMIRCYDALNEVEISDEVSRNSSDVDSWDEYPVQVVQAALESLSDIPERDQILLRLLKHSLADFQPDHLLAANILEYARDWNCCQNIHFFKGVIARFLLDRVICNGRCARNSIEDKLEHSCHKWQRLELILGEVLALGLKEYTTEHALLVCAFFKITLDTANPSAGEKDDEIVSNTGSTSRKSRKAKLKQALYLWKMTDYDDNESDEDSDNGNVNEMIPYRVMCEFVSCLGRQAGKCRQKVFDSTSDLNTFCNTIGTFVFLGETAIRRLPAKNDSIELCSKIVASFIGSYVYDWDSHISDLPYFRSPDLPSVIDPGRYANAINTATDRFMRLKKIEQDWVTYWTSISRSDLKVIRPFVVPKDVFDVIKGCFARDLATIERTGAGYGDCLVWMGGEITGHDPYLFFSDTHNYPTEDDDEDSENDNDQESPVWVYDEDNKPVSSRHLPARYDFTLLKLVQAWNSPWSPERHYSFQKEYRDAVRALFLSMYRHKIPHEVSYHIVQFLPRSFWPDERSRCWCDDCSVDNSVALMMWKLGGMVVDQYPKLYVTKFCDCKVAMYKNNDHRKKDAGQHRKWCNTIPLRIPGPKDDLFCQVIESKLKDEDLNVLNQESEADDCDDDESWESIESGEEEENDLKGVTQLIHDYFRRNSYKLHEVKESAFQAMYS